MLYGKQRSSLLWRVGEGENRASRNTQNPPVHLIFHPEEAAQSFPVPFKGGTRRKGIVGGTLIYLGVATCADLLILGELLNSPRL